MTVNGNLPEMGNAHSMLTFTKRAYGPMRKLLFWLGVFLCLSGAALAQESGGRPGEWTLHAAFGAVVVGLILANTYVVGLFHAKDRKSTRLNSSHGYISYAVFCLKKKK